MELLWAKKMAECCEENSHILIPRAAIGNAEIIRELSVRKDLVVDDVATYETRYEVQSIVDESGAFERGEIDYAVFTSASTVRGTCTCFAGAGIFQSESGLYRKADGGAGGRIRNAHIYGKRSVY